MGKRVGLARVQRSQSAISSHLLALRWNFYLLNFSVPGPGGVGMGMDEILEDTRAECGAYDVILSVH